MQKIRLLNLQKIMKISRFKRGTKQVILLFLNVFWTLFVVNYNYESITGVITFLPALFIVLVWPCLLMYTILKWFIRKSVYDSMGFDRELNEGARRLRKAKKELYVEMEMNGIYDDDLLENIRIRSQKVVDFQRYVDNFELPVDNTDPECRLAEIMLEELEKEIKGDDWKAKTRKRIDKLFVRMIFW